MLKPNSDLDARKSYIAVLLMLAEADDKDHANEERFINDVADRLDLTPEDVNEIDKHPENLVFSFPKTEVERMNLLYHLLFLMKIDGSVDPKEKELCHELGFRFGFRAEMVDELIVVMENHIGQIIPPGTLLNIIKKYMN
ncbi:hypothetical protein QQ008_27745 [Fulvivirgaceae bacterium BMA10]|uniref:TerB family tellurite resistance protein n=1 Tax=Splendidivirga corallicola TaxID=3051826 RepID=A0ABT8KWR0_9BACT|nr:hypothetical protein [Fulvivirgaceae bacterium BMA10]